ncbi:MAG: HD domain-containing phosphohydrolase, partial [Armatimonadota bacterium]
AAALGQPIAIPEPAGIAVPAAEPATSRSLLDFVRRHWNTLEFDRPLAMVGAEEGEPLTSLPASLSKALVCRDQDSGDLVVLTVAESGAGVDVVGQTLRHIGWLQQHEPDAGQRATGLIVAEQPTDDLVYAASAAPNVELATLRLQLSPLSEAPVSAVGAEHRFWRTIERLSAWCAVHSLEATLAAAGAEPDPVAEGSPIWDFVTTLARSVDYRCPWTVGHSTRVAELLVVMADRLRLGGDVRQYLRMAGFLHDVGNMGVPSHLFDKRTRLSADELSAFRRHPELGARIVREMNLLSPVAAGVYHHHERLDGRGYPSGLVGDDIPLMARMVGVACSFDAMTSRRPYREAIRPETALDIMRAEAGQHWDAGIVDTIARIVG